MYKSTITNRSILFSLCLLIGLASGCGGRPTKGAGAKSASAAKSASSSQKVGTAKSETSSATNSGSTSGDIACDSGNDGLAFCASDTQIVFCASGSWWTLSCTAVDSAAYCGQDTAAGIIDCFIDE